MLTKLNRKILNTKSDLYDNNVKLFTGFYSDSWKSITTASNSWSALAINEDGLIFAISNINSTLIYSSNGGNSWTTISVGTAPMKSIAYARTKNFSRFVVIGHNFLMYSNKKDPINAGDWFTSGITTEVSPTVVVSGIPQFQWEDIVFDGGLFIAVAKTHATTGGLNQRLKRIALSRDGINWRLDTAPFAYDFPNPNQSINPEWKTTTYGNGRFIIAANGPSNLPTTVSRILYSNNDGNTWTEARNDLRNVEIVKSVTTWQDSTYSPKLNLFILVANSGPYRLIYSRDGENWSNEGISATINSLDLSSISWSPELEMFIGVASGTTSPRFITSNDGIIWTFRTFHTSSKSTVSLVWNKKYNNFIGCSNATAATDNIFVTKSLGIDALQTSLDRYFNKTSLTNFSYLNPNQTSIETITGADFGISPIININVHNTYTVDQDFPPGIFLNPSNGIIYGKNFSVQTFSRVVTAYNNATGESLSTVVTISIIPGKVTIDNFYYYLQDSSDTSYKLKFILTEPNSRSVFIPIVDGSSPFVYSFQSTTAQNGIFNLNSSNGILEVNSPKLEVFDDFNVTIRVYNNYDNFRDVTIEFTCLRLLNANFSYTPRYTINIVRWERQVTKYGFELWTEFGVIQWFPRQETERRETRIYYTELIADTYISPRTLIFKRQTYYLNYIQFFDYDSDSAPGGGFSIVNGVGLTEDMGLRMLITAPGIANNPYFFNSVTIFGVTYIPNINLTYIYNNNDSITFISNGVGIPAASNVNNAQIIFR